MNKEILKWYDSNKRILPWRDDKDPYKIWISEIMLQQTRVETVIPYFNRFIKELPNVYALANTDEDHLLKLWEGLGYYSRVRNIHKASKQIVNQYNGVIPNTKKELESLVGIGPYTSGAILSIAYNQNYTAVDGNVLRVFARVMNIKEDIKSKDVKIKIKSKVEGVSPKKRIGDFNQALMEIGATICIPNGAPKCELCPIKLSCLSYQNNTTHLIPIKQKKKKNPIKKYTVLLLKFNEKYMIEKRSSKGLLANLYQFPMQVGHLSKTEIETMYENNIKSVKPLSKSTHKFSHLSWDMIGYEIHLKNEMEGTYYTAEEIENILSIPTAFKEYKKIIK